MALEIDFPDRTDDICKDAYIVAELTLSNVKKNGRLELATWKNEEHRLAGKLWINNVGLFMDKEEIWFKKPEIIEGERDLYPGYEIGDNVYILTLAYDDFAWKSGEEVYRKIKTLKIKVDDIIIDLSNSEDV